MGRRGHHSVYVVELSKEVLCEAKFVRCNPGSIVGKPCVYVGMRGLDPDIRFDKHKAGIQSNAYVQWYGRHLVLKTAWSVVYPRLVQEGAIGNVSGCRRASYTRGRNSSIPGRMAWYRPN